MELLRINSSNIYFLSRFIDKLGSASEHFRYFNSRTIDVIENHLITLMFVEGSEPIAYGHLDVDDGIIWLGIAVLPDFQGQGYGKNIMSELIIYAKKESINRITLTVDNNNKSAIGLYKKFGFKKILKLEKYSKFVLELK